VIQFDDFPGETARIVCPFCASSRRKSRLKEMTLTKQPDGAVLFYCHHCDANGSVQPEKRQEFKLSAVPQPKILENALQSAHYEYLATRGISKETADQYKLFAGRKWFARLNKEADCIGFPYIRNGALVGVKYRSFQEKDFTQESGGAHDFFGLDNITPDRPIVIVEGEIDALTLHEAGVENVLSVPGGAPVKVADGRFFPRKTRSLPTSGMRGRFWTRRHSSSLQPIKTHRGRHSQRNWPDASAKKNAAQPSSTPKI